MKGNRQQKEYALPCEPTLDQNVTYTHMCTYVCMYILQCIYACPCICFIHKRLRSNIKILMIMSKQAYGMTLTFFFLLNCIFKLFIVNMYM